MSKLSRIGEAACAEKTCLKAALVAVPADVSIRLVLNHGT